MSDVINYLQHRVEEVRRDHQLAMDRMMQAAAERDLLASELQGYEKALSAEVRRQGFATVATKPDAQGTLSLPDLNSDSTNKAEFARQFIRRCPDGVDPGQIFEAFRCQNIPIKKPYVYALVQRLRDQGAIRQRRGRWFSISDSDQQQTLAESVEILP
jgi:hypothetical protein